ncbi:MAG: hypothetical protein AUI11_04215 [Acidobacteria bacterium 13_2_20CM_2_66_4]|nr:MAG: hypothetical protein AUI11_04215 [Acidobacteria bacterium 13_2_20CM_2_66_4]
MATVSEALESSRRLWDAHAQSDPLWAILSDPAKHGGKWNLHRFFQTGVGEIATLLYELARLGVAVKTDRALDFGCGIGRLTQALAERFTRVVGVDISSQMIERAKHLNRFPERVTYLSNDVDDLAVLGSERFDFIVSRIVLQHIAPDVAVRYLRELCRLMAPGGSFVVQAPSRRRGPDDPVAPQTAKPMPDEAYRANIAVAGVLEGTLGPGEPITLDVEITNNSRLAWLQNDVGRVTIGNHWLDRHGEMIRRDDGRTGVPQIVHAGEAVHVPLTVTLPREDGEYECELDLVHEGVFWFTDKGSASLRLPVGIRHGVVAIRSSDNGGEITHVLASIDDGLPVASLTAVEPAPFPMYGLARETVLDVLADCGVRIVAVEDDRSCGDDWVSYQYFATSGEA